MVSTLLLLILFLSIACVVTFLFYEVATMYGIELTTWVTIYFVAVFVISMFAGVAAYLKILQLLDINYHITAVLVGLLAWVFCLVGLNVVLLNILSRLTK